MAPEAVRKLVEQAAALPANLPIAEIPEEQRLFAIELPEQLMVMVGRITGVTPVASEDFVALTSTGAMTQLVLGPQVTSLRDQLFSRQAMEARLGFKLAREFEEVESQDDPAPAGDAAPPR